MTAATEAPSPLWGGVRGGDTSFIFHSIDTLDDFLLAEAVAEYDRMRGRFGHSITAFKGWPFSSTPDELYFCFRNIQAYEAWQAHGAWISANATSLGGATRHRFEFGKGVTLDTLEAERARRAAFRAEFASFLSDGAMLVLPTVPGASPLKASPEALPAYRERALHLLCLSGLSGFPQITVPVGTVDGAPFGLSIIGPAGSDLALIGLARDFLANAAKS